MAVGHAIGIDLGTTFSCVSVYRRGRPELIPNVEGERLTPSIVYYNPRNGAASVGWLAYKLLRQCPQNGLLDAKRFMGRKYDDVFISRYKNSNHVHFSLVRGDDDQVAFEIEVSNEKIVKKPEEVSAEVLKYLKRTASDYLGFEVSEAVISVPAYFSNAQRKATKNAAELAGLNVLKLITEPTAAAIHYVSDKVRINSNILAFDFGGGTLDVSLIKVNNNVFEVKSVYGDTLLGGRDFDKILFEHFEKKFKDILKDKNSRTMKFKRTLNNLCVNLKKSLSTCDEITLYIDNYDGNSDLSISMSRTEFEDICSDIFQRVLNVVELCLSDSSLAKSDIEEVVLVGGSTRIPKIREQLSTYFGQDKIKTDLNPDEAVAAGASIQAALLLGDSTVLEKYKVTEVTPMSLGLRGSGNVMTFFIPKNSPLPIQRSQTRVTVYNDQTSVTFPIFEGERKNCAFNNKLGEFTISNLPKKRAGDVVFSVDFKLDEDGILSVTARETSTGQNNKLVVTMGQFQLSDSKIKATIEDAKKYTAEDNIFEKFMLRKSNVQRKCRHVLYDVKKISDKSDRTIVKNSSETFLSVLMDLDFSKIDELESKFLEYKKTVEGILKKNSMSSLL